MARQPVEFIDLCTASSCGLTSMGAATFPNTYKKPAKVPTCEASVNLGVARTAHARTWVVLQIKRSTGRLHHELVRYQALTSEAQLFLSLSPCTIVTTDGRLQGSLQRRSALGIAIIGCGRGEISISKPFY
jgi:hypothetical protein